MTKAEEAIEMQIGALVVEINSPSIPRDEKGRLGITLARAEDVQRWLRAQEVATWLQDLSGTACISLTSPVVQDILRKRLEFSE